MDYGAIVVFISCQRTIVLDYLRPCGHAVCRFVDELFNRIMFDQIVDGCALGPSACLRNVRKDSF